MDSDLLIWYAQGRVPYGVCVPSTSLPGIWPMHYLTTSYSYGRGMICRQIRVSVRRQLWFVVESTWVGRVFERYLAVDDQPSYLLLRGISFARTGTRVLARLAPSYSIIHSSNVSRFEQISQLCADGPSKCVTITYCVCCELALLLFAVQIGTVRILEALEKKHMFFSPPPGWRKSAAPVLKLDRA